MILAKKKSVGIIVLFFVILHRFIIAEAAENREKSKTIEERVEQIKMGNFALKASQQPGPLVSFGQNMVDKGDLQLFSFIDDFVGCDQKTVSIIPTLLYGFRDNFSLYVQMPILAKYSMENKKLSGLQDLLVQLEYAFYDQMTERTTNQMSIVGNITLPTGSVPSSVASLRGHGSFGVPTFFIGFTADHFSTAWYTFVSTGIKVIPEHKKTKLGDWFFYQCGLSKNVYSQADYYIINLTLEFDGIYKQQSRNCGLIDPNSGGNQILFGPSLWFSTPHFSLQAGISGVVYQHLHGKQHKNNYLISIDIGYKF